MGTSLFGLRAVILYDDSSSEDNVLGTKCFDPKQFLTCQLSSVTKRQLLLLLFLSWVSLCLHRWFSPPDGVRAIVAPPKRALMASISISSSQKSKTKSRILAPIHVESVNWSGLRDPGWLTYLGIVEFAGNRLLNGVFSAFSSDGFLTCPTSAKSQSCYE